MVGYRVRLVRKNLADSFPEKSERECLEIEKAFYHWFCDYLVETVKLLTISREELRRRMVFKGAEIVDEIVASGR
jgi:KDO2-lipid IV(A) lauroyltransferase